MRCRSFPVLTSKLPSFGRCCVPDVPSPTATCPWLPPVSCLAPPVSGESTMGAGSGSGSGAGSGSGTCFLGTTFSATGTCDGTSGCPEPLFSFPSPEIGFKGWWEKERGSCQGLRRGGRGRGGKGRRALPHVIRHYTREGSAWGIHRRCGL